LAEFLREAGIIYGNAAAKLERMPVRPKQLTLPSRVEFLQLVEWLREPCMVLARLRGFFAGPGVHRMP